MQFNCCVKNLNLKLTSFNTVRKYVSRNFFCKDERERERERERNETGTGAGVGPVERERGTGANDGRNVYFDRGRGERG